MRRYAARVARLERALSIDAHAPVRCQHSITVYSWQPDPKQKSEYHDGEVLCVKCRAAIRVVNITFVSAGRSQARYAQGVVTGPPEVASRGCSGTGEGPNLPHAR